MRKFNECFALKFSQLLVLSIAGLQSPQADAILISDNGMYPLGSLPQDASNPFNGVLKIWTRRANGWSSCSGTAITPTLVVSAAHCFDGNDPGGAADAVEVLVQYYDANPQVLNWSSISGIASNHPNYTGLVDGRGSEAQFAHDIAVVRLENPLPTPTFKIVDYGRAFPGMVVTHAGYGTSGFGSTGGIYPAGYSLNATMNTLDTIFNGGLQFGTDFDGIGINVFGGGPLGLPGLKGSVLPYEGSTSFGDSGGPAFFNPYLQGLFSPSQLPIWPKLVPDEYFLLGVTSWGRNDGYGKIGGYTLVHPFLDWIRGFDEAVALADLSDFPLFDRTPEVFSLEGLLLEAPPVVEVPPARVPAAPTLLLLILGLTAALTPLSRNRHPPT